MISPESGIGCHINDLSIRLLIMTVYYMQTNICLMAPSAIALHVQKLINLCYTYNL